MVQTSPKPQEQSPGYMRTDSLDNCTVAVPAARVVSGVMASAMPSHSGMKVRFIWREGLNRRCSRTVGKILTSPEMAFSPAALRSSKSRLFICWERVKLGFNPGGERRFRKVGHLPTRPWEASRRFRPDSGATIAKLTPASYYGRTPCALTATGLVTSDHFYERFS
jgi:hypothetical protein